MSHEDDGSTQRIAGKDSGNRVIVQVLRKYFGDRVPSEKSVAGNANESLIIKAIKRYFKGNGWP